MTSPPTYPRVLIIAGSDSGGGAGIQADIKTCAAYGVYSASAITAITAQNTQAVQAVQALPADMVAAQIKSVMTDIGADVIKIGMLANAGIINVVADMIDEYASETTVVLDPVMVATSGDSLLEDEAIEALKSRLIPHADVITPNVPEAARLTGLPISDYEELQAAGRALLEMGAYSAVMKGGHMQGNAIMDILVTDAGISMMGGPRLYTRHTHGTGCTLASAIAAGLAQGGDLSESLEPAVRAARDFVYDAIADAPQLGSGGKGTHGPLNHGLTPIGAKEDADALAEPSGHNPFSALKGL